MEIIVRQAESDFHALLIAQGMENAGATVFSIAHNGMHQPYGAMLPSARFVVFAKFSEPVTCDKIDEMIEFQFNEHM